MDRLPKVRTAWPPPGTTFNPHLEGTKSIVRWCNQFISGTVSKVMKLWHHAPDVLSHMPHPLIRESAEALTLLYSALKEKNRDKVILSLQSALPILERLSRANDPEKMIYQSKYLQEGDLQDISFSITTLIDHMREYLELLTSDREEINQETLRLARKQILQDLRGRNNDTSKLSRSLDQPPSSRLTSELYINNGVLFTLQQIFYQNNGLVKGSVDAVRDVVVTSLTEPLRRHGLFPERVSSAQKVDQVDIPLRQIGQEIDEDEAPLEEVEQEESEDAPPQLEGLFHTLGEAIATLSEFQLTFFLKPVLYPLIIALEALETKLEKDEARDILPHISESMSLLKKIYEGKIYGKAACMHALQVVFQNLSRHSYWVGNVFNFGLISDERKKLSDAVSETLRVTHANLNQQYRAIDIPEEISDSLLAEKIETTETICITKGVFETYSWIVGSKIRFETIYANVKTKLHPSSDKSQAIKELLIVEIKRLIDASKWFFLWGFVMKFFLKISIRPLFWLYSLCISTILNQVKEPALSLLSDHSSLKKERLLQKPLELFTSVTKGVRASYLEHAKSPKCNSFDEASVQYFTENREFLNAPQDEKRWNFKILTQKVGDKLIGTYMPKFTISKLLDRLQKKVTHQIHQMHNIFVRGFFWLIYGFPIITVTYLIYFVIIPIEAISNYLIRLISRIFLRKTHLIHDLIQNTLAPFKNLHDKIPPHTEVVDKSVLIQDKIMIILMQHLYEEMRTSDDKDSSFAKISVDPITKQEMHIAVQNMLEAIGASSVHTPNDALIFEREGVVHDAAISQIFTLTKNFLGASRTHSILASTLDELLTRCYYLAADPKLLKKLTHLALTSLDEALTQEGETTTPEKIKEEHQKNLHYIQSLQFLSLERALAALATATSYQDEDHTIQKHGEELKRWLLPSSDPRITLPTDFLRRLPRELLEIIDNPEDANTIERLNRLFDEYMQMIEFINDKPLLMQLKDKAGSASIALYTIALTPIKEALLAFQAPFMEIYKTFFDMSILQDKIPSIEMQARRIAPHLQEIEQKLQDLLVTIQGPDLIKLERSFTEITLHLSHCKLALDFLKILHRSAKGHKSLSDLLFSLEDTVVKLSRFVDQYKRAYTLENLISLWKNSGEGSMNLNDYLLHLRKHKNINAYLRFKENRILPLLEKIFPRFRNEQSFDEKNYKIVETKLREIEIQITSDADDGLQRTLQGLDQFFDEIVRRSRGILTEDETDFTLPKCQEALATSLDYQEVFLENIARERATWDELSDGSDRLHEPLTQIEEIFRNLTPIVTRFNPTISSIKFSLSDIPAYKSATFQIIPIANEFFNRVATMFLRRGPMYGMIARAMQLYVEESM